MIVRIMVGLFLWVLWMVIGAIFVREPREWIVVFGFGGFFGVALAEWVING